jgi:hypothetical protein
MQSVIALSAYASHDLAAAAVHEWTWEPLVVVPLLATTALYAWGLRNV